MQTETYEVISNNPAEGDNALVAELKSPEAVELITTLGLKGQEALLVERQTEGGETVVERFPYRRMTKDEDRVYGFLMPQKTKLVDYKDGPVPLRVLQVAAHATDLFDEPLIVWHPEGAIDDPILIGIKHKPTTNPAHPVREVFLLARWGDVLLPFEEMRVKARELWVQKARGTASKGLAQLQAFLAGVDNHADAFFAGEGPSWGTGIPRVVDY